MRFTTRQVAAITGFTMNYIKQIVFRGYIKPSHPATGTGDHHSWTLLDVYRVALFRQLMQLQVPAKEAGRISLEFPAGHLTPIDFMEDQKDVFVFFWEREGRYHVTFTDLLPEYFSRHKMTDAAGKEIPLISASVINLRAFKMDIDRKISAAM